MAPIGCVSSARTCASQLWCVSRQPFGRPVVPEVYTRDARSLEFVASIRARTSSSLMPRPSNLRVGIAEALISSTRRSFDDDPFNGGRPSVSNSRRLTMSVCSGVSVTANTAPESSIIHSTWLSDDDP